MRRAVAPRGASEEQAETASSAARSVHVDPAAAVQQLAVSPALVQHVNKALLSDELAGEVEMRRDGYARRHTRFRAVLIARRIST